MKGLLDWMMYQTGTGPYAIEAIKQRNKPRTLRERVMANPDKWPVSENIQTPEPPGPYHYLRNEYDFRSTPTEPEEEQMVVRSGKGRRLPVSQSNRRFPKGIRRLEDALAETKNKIGRKK